MGGDEPPNRVKALANTSLLLVDSQSRNVISNPNPCDFAVELNVSGSGLRRIVHRNLQWTQPFYSHTMEDWEIIITFSGDGFVERFRGYMPPFVSFQTFVGDLDDEGANFPTPAVHSYCAALEAVLQTGLRSESTPFVTTAFPTFFVTYSKSRGMLIGLTTAVGIPDYFRLEFCSWLNKGHNVHGFGIPITTVSGGSLKAGGGSTGEVRYAMEPSLYENGTNLWFSSGTPLGVYSRYVTAFSKEICRNRKVTSFSNVKKNGLLNATELTVLPCSYARNGVLKNNVTTDDPTVVNLRDGDALQVFEISIADESGRVIECGEIGGNPIQAYTASLILDGVYTVSTLPYDLSTAYLSSTVPPYDNDLTTSLLKEEGNFFRDFPKMKASRMDSSSPIVHYLELWMM